MPIFVPKPKAGTSVGAPEALAADIAVPELVPRNCRLRPPYEPKKVRSIEVDGEIIAYASPDSTYAVTKRLMDDARKSILIGIYDFSAAHMRELILDALARGVKVSLMLDIDNEAESNLFDELAGLGVVGVPAPSCAHDTVKVFRSSHEKVIVIDGEWCLVQSGNYSDHSIPLNVVDGGDRNNFRKGNRDTGLAVRSRKLARFFADILDSDMELATAEPEAARRFPAEEFFAVEAAPKKIPERLFPSKTFRPREPLKITPVLSPDNYMDIVPKLLREAKRSLLIEQQYIKAKQPKIRSLLQAIKAARDENPDLDVRIILGKIFKAGDLPKEEENLEILEEDFALKLGKNIRYINTERFVHCHNKMVLIDGLGVLSSSQNWSDSAVSENREAGLYLKHSGIAGYFRDIFESDWKSAFKSPSKGVSGVPETATPQSLQRGGFIRVALADYQEV
jgi:phosphatidylserine/phosphatidylglycerophosphate/cardiolipin synthase-like enzyme